MNEVQAWSSRGIETERLPARPSVFDADMAAPTLQAHMHVGRAVQHGTGSDLETLMRTAIDVDGYYTQRQVESMVQRLNDQEEGRFRSFEAIDETEAATGRDTLIDKLSGREDAAIKIQRAWRKFLKGKDKRRFMTKSLSIRRVDHYVPDRFYTSKKARAPAFMSYSIESAPPPEEQESEAVIEPVTPAVKMSKREPMLARTTPHLECIQRAFGSTFVPAQKLYKSKTGGSSFRSSHQLGAGRHESSSSGTPLLASDASDATMHSESLNYPDVFHSSSRPPSCSSDLASRASLPGLPLRPSITHTQSARGHRPLSRSRAGICSDAGHGELAGSCGQPAMDSSSSSLLPVLLPLQVAWPEKNTSGEQSPMSRPCSPGMMRSPSARSRSTAGCEALQWSPSPLKHPLRSEIAGRRSDTSSLDSSQEDPLRSLASAASVHRHAESSAALGHCHSVPGFPLEGAHSPMPPTRQSLGGNASILRGHGHSMSNLPRAMQGPSACLSSGQLGAMAGGTRQNSALKNGSNGVLQPRHSHLAPTLSNTSARPKARPSKAPDASKMFQEWKAQRKRDGVAVPEDGAEDHGESFLSYVQRRMAGSSSP